MSSAEDPDASPSTWPPDAEVAWEATIGRLVPSLVHRVNNQLATIMGQAELTLATLPADSPVKARIERVVNAADRGSAFIRDLREVGTRRGDTGETADLVRVATHAARFFQVLWGKTWEVEVGEGPDHVVVATNAERLYAALVMIIEAVSQVPPTQQELTVQATAESHRGELTLAFRHAENDPAALVSALTAVEKPLEAILTTSAEGMTVRPAEQGIDVRLGFPLANTGA